MPPCGHPSPFSHHFLFLVYAASSKLDWTHPHLLLISRLLLCVYPEYIHYYYGTLLLAFSAVAEFVVYSSGRYKRRNVAEILHSWNTKQASANLCSAQSAEHYNHTHTHTHTRWDDNNKIVPLLHSEHFSLLCSLWGWRRWWWCWQRRSLVQRVLPLLLQQSNLCLHALQFILLFSLLLLNCF